MTGLIAGSPWGRRVIAGFLTWLVPFLAAVPLYGRDGAPLLDIALFKSLMIVIASLTAAVIMVWYFSRATQPYTREAVITGAVWLAMNWALDLIVLVGLLGMAPGAYAAEIGLRYLIIPAMVIPAGIIADRAVERAGD
ncbi:MAG: hypothetical protein M0Q92_03855 [Methanoregula sp.]|jgi:phosphoglycerol transferase MdoB-like AlkP superfamily enzyme|nr:hypothetical protein [Methanoregula sp.]